MMKRLMMMMMMMAKMRMRVLPNSTPDCSALVFFDPLKLVGCDDPQEEGINADLFRPRSRPVKAFTAAVFEFASAGWSQSSLAYWWT